MHFKHDTAAAHARQMGVVLLVLAGLHAVPAALPAQHSAHYQARNAAALVWLASHAAREEQVMVAMRDGVRLASLLLFPKDRPRRNLPTILFRHPYSTEAVVKAFASYLRELLSSGYAVMFQSVRGRYFSEGTYTFLVGSGNDGYDTVEWITQQRWSNGKVGTLGCSSSAEEQHKLNAMRHPGLAATVPIGSGAGIGKVGPYNEMGNFYRGGAIQNLWFSWYYGAGYTHRPRFPRNLPRETMLRLSRFWSIEPDTVPPAGLDSVLWTLPINTILERMQAAPSDLDDFVNRLPNDPRWRTTEFGSAADQFGAPMLMINSWYDISMGPNVALFEHQTRHAATRHARDNMFMVIAPTLHCQQGKVETEHTMVGERDLGDTRFDYVKLVREWFDYFMQGVENGVTKQPKVRAYMMGANQWRSYSTWPPKAIRYVRYYLDSDGRANSVQGNGRITTARPAAARSDTFTYDPRLPVPSLGGGVCCFSALQGGAFDQSGIEMRTDVLVYTTPPLEATLEIAGPVSVSLYLSSTAKDTDLTVKLLDVYPDGRAYNLDDSIQRVRWREGWDTPVFMEAGRVYRVEVGPLVTSNTFLPGHRLRIEVSSSNFPRFERNLNTGGNNFDEKDGVVAHNVIHHGPKHPSMVMLPVLRGGPVQGARSWDRGKQTRD